MSASAVISRAVLTPARMAALAGGGAASLPTGDYPPVSPANVFQFATPDPTGATDSSAAIKAAHDAAVALGHRYLYFPPGTYHAPALVDAGLCIFVGEGVMTGAYQKSIIPWALPVRRIGGNDVVPARHLTHFLAALATATPLAPAIVALVGDSTTTNTQSPFSTAEWFLPLVQNRLNEDFGADAASISVQGMGIGGQTWRDLNGVAHSNHPSYYTDRSAPWLPYIRNVTAGATVGPDLVIFNFGMNDHYGFDLTDLHAVIAKIKAWPKVPSLLFCINYVPSNMIAPVNDVGHQAARDFVAGYQRSYAQKNGYGIIDFNRQFHLLRDGFDIRRQTLQQFASGLSVRLPYSFPTPTFDFDVLLQFASTPWTGGAQLTVQIGNAPGNTLVLEQDVATGNVAYTVNAAPGVPSIPRTVSPHTAHHALNVGIGCKGGLLTLIAGPNVIGNFAVERFGGVFRPIVSLTGSQPPSTVTLTSASNSVPLPSMPLMIDSDLFQDPSISGGVHMSPAGIENVIGACLDATRFAA